jgi:hypothetical protein
LQKTQQLNDGITIPGGDVLLSPKQLAAELGRDVSYIYAMKKRGFALPGGLSTVNNCLLWLSKNPPPRSRSPE